MIRCILIHTPLSDDSAESTVERTNEIHQYFQENEANSLVPVISQSQENAYKNTALSKMPKIQPGSPLLTSSAPLENDTLGKLQTQLKKQKLLTKEEEIQLSSDMRAICSQMVVEILSHPTAAQNLLALLQSLLFHPLKMAMFPNRRQYYSLRREVLELINPKQNQTLIKDIKKTFSAAERTADRLIEPSDRFDRLIQHAKQLEWPAPLVIAIAKRFDKKNKALSELDLALSEYISTLGQINWSSNIQKKERLRRRLQTKAKRYYLIRNKFVARNLGLVIKIAQRFANNRAELLELIQEGTIGLIRAAEKYHSNSGCRFSTYAYAWIESKIRSAKVNHDEIIPVPPDLNLELSKLKQTIANFKSQQPCYNLEDLAKALNCKVTRIKFLLQFGRLSLSLDDTFDEDGRVSYHSKLPAPGEDTFQKVVNTDVKEKLQQIMNRSLTDREVYILNERFGCLDSEPKTFTQISEKLGISRERIRQIEISALEKLRSYLTLSGTSGDFSQYIQK